MTNHDYLPTTLISDKGIAFMSHVNKGVAGVLAITLKHATTKHAQTIGLLEQSHASIRQALKIETGEQSSLWHKNVSTTVLKYNTFYHASIGCEPSRTFLGLNPYSILDLKVGICPRSNKPFLLRILPKMFLIKQKRSTKVFAKTPCKLTSNIKLITTKRPTFQHSKKKIMYTSYSRKRIIKGVKLLLQNFGGLALTLLKKCYLTTFICYAKLAPTRRKCFIVCQCVNSHPANPQLIYESRHKNENLIRKWAPNTMICMPERGSVNTKSQFLTTRILMQRLEIHPKFQ